MSKLAYMPTVVELAKRHPQMEGCMTLEFAQKEAQRRTTELGATHYVYQSMYEIGEYIVTARELNDGRSPVHTYFADGSELET